MAEPIFSAEENNERSWYASGLAGIASGLIKVPEGGSFHDMVALKGNKEIGDKIMIKVIRNGQSRMIFAHIGKKPNKM